MADKFITMHPTVNGTLDTTTNIFPNIRASQNIYKDNGTRMDVQEKLTSGTNIKSLKIGSNSASASSLLGSGSLTIDLLNLLYPIGTIYTCNTNVAITKDASSNPICPIQTLLGGVWTPIYDTFLFAAKKGTHSVSKDYYPGDSGGSKDAIIPYHNHTIASGGGNHTHTTEGGSKTLTGYFTIKEMYSGGTLISDWSGCVSVEKNIGNNENSIDDIAGTQKKRMKVKFDFAHTHNIASSGSHTHTVNYAGSSGNATGANMPPYKAVYAWYRAS